MVKGALVELITKHYCLKNCWNMPYRPARQSNNPGMLRIGPRGLTLNEFDVLQFPTPEAGLSALRRRIEKGIDIGRNFLEIAGGNNKLAIAIVGDLIELGFTRATKLTIAKDLLENVQLYRPANGLHERSRVTG